MVRLAGRPLVALVTSAALLVLGGCEPGVATTPAPAPSTATPAPATVAPVAPTAEPEATPAAGQAETEWGPIWTAVPSGFPAPPDGEPTLDVDTAASAAWTVAVAAGTGPSARAVADVYGRAFTAIGLGGGVDGPLEDGSSTAWASNGYGCDILVTVLPRGSEELLVTVLFGAGCPFRWVAS